MKKTATETPRMVGTAVTSSLRTCLRKASLPPPLETLDQRIIGEPARLVEASCLRTLWRLEGFASGSPGRRI